MCGIAGFTAPPGSLNPETARETVKRMTDLIAYRGPDGAGEWADDTAALGHRRLAILDLSGGAQPMLSADGSLILSYNGEIYNYRELTAELTAHGHRFATRSDTEVLLHGYRQWGTALPNRLRGMFAFALWDKKSETLFACRDFFGIKPLYYWQKGGTLLFASEIKSFFAHPAFEKRFNAARLPDFLSTQYLPDAETLFEGVYELPGGCHLLWHAADPTRVTIERWAAPRFAPRPGMAMHRAAHTIRRAVADSVATHRLADVEVGCFLSGGVDSAFLARVAGRANPALKTFSVGYAEKTYSELDKAAASARLLQLPFQATRVTAAQFFAVQEKILWYLDEPLPNPAEVPLYFLCEAAAKQVKVVLSGEGADELFGGYPLYSQAVYAAHYRCLMPKFLRQVLAKSCPEIAFLRRGALEPWQASARANYVFADPAERDCYLRRKPSVPPPAARFAPWYRAARGLPEPAATQLVDLYSWLPKDILRKADRMSMAHSLELRVPYLDREVFAAAAVLPPPLRATGRQTKIAFRAAAAGVLPREIAYRKKCGFTVPLACWLRQEPYYSKLKTAFVGEAAARFFDTAALVRLLDAHRAGKISAMLPLWSFYSFILWYEQIFLRGTPPAGIYRPQQKNEKNLADDT